MYLCVYIIYHHTHNIFRNSWHARKIKKKKCIIYWLVEKNVLSWEYELRWWENGERINGTLCLHSQLFLRLYRDDIYFIYSLEYTNAAVTYENPPYYNQRALHCHTITISGGSRILSWGKEYKIFSYIICIGIINFILLNVQNKI
jgi:hypothetical protein